MAILNIKEVLLYLLLAWTPTRRYCPLFSSFIGILAEVLDITPLYASFSVGNLPSEEKQ